MRDQTNAIREQVSFKQREEHIRESWNFLCSHYHLNKSDLVKFLIKKEEYFLRKPETIPAGFVKDWLWDLKNESKNALLSSKSNWIHWITTYLRPTNFWWRNWTSSNGNWWSTRYKTSTGTKRMNSKTRSLIQEIKRKVKSPITGNSIFADDAAVIAMAIQQFYDNLKQKKVL